MSLGGSSDQLFTYSSLFKGGLVGVIVVTILLLYVVFLVEFIYGMDLRPLSQNDILTNVRIFLNISIIGVLLILLFYFRFVVSYVQFLNAYLLL
jgi:hypothetical protein